MKYWTIGIVIIFALAGSAKAETLFEDGFETGDLSLRGQSGFSWSGTNRTNVVSQSVRDDGTPKPAGSDWTAKEGNHSLLFRYPAGEPMSEQRFAIGGAHDEIWISFWTRVPINYTHNQDSPSNNKFLAVWMDDYSYQGDGSTVFWGTWSNGRGGSDIAIAYSEGGNEVAGAYDQSVPFISVPQDRGRWMRVVFRMKSESTRGARDGIIEMWRKWEGQSGFTKIHEELSAGISKPASGPQGFSRGYLMGWSNPTYVEDTEWLLDSFRIATENFADGPAAGPISAPPVAPVAR